MVSSRSPRRYPVSRPTPVLLLALGLLGSGVGAVLGGCATDQREGPAPVVEHPDPPASPATPPAASPEDDVRRARPILAAPSEVAVDQGDPLLSVRNTGEGRVVVVYVPSDGWAYPDGEGTLTGASVEILRDFFQWVESRERVTLEVIWAADDDWTRFYRRVRNGTDGVFGIGNVTMTQARRSELDFSPPYLNNVAVLITHAAVPELASMEEASHAFEGFTAHPYRGTLHEERVNALRERRIPGLRVLPLDSNDEILEAVASSPDRLAWIDVYAYWRGVEQGLPLRRHPAGDDDSEALGIILPRGSDWTPLLEAFFEEGEGYRNGDRYVQHLRRHLGNTVTDLLEEARLARQVPEGR